LCSFNESSPSAIYTLSLHDALPISFADCSNNAFPSFLFLNVAIDSVFYENALQRSKMPLFFQLIQLDFQFTFQQFHRAVRTSARSEEHTSELQSRENLVCRLLLEKK